MKSSSEVVAHRGWRSPGRELRRVEARHRRVGDRPLGLGGDVVPEAKQEPLTVVAEEHVGRGESTDAARPSGRGIDRRVRGLERPAEADDEGVRRGVRDARVGRREVPNDLEAVGHEGALEGDEGLGPLPHGQGRRNVRVAHLVVSDRERFERRTHQGRVAERTRLDEQARHAIAALRPAHDEGRATSDHRTCGEIRACVTWQHHRRSLEGSAAYPRPGLLRTG